MIRTLYGATVDQDCDEAHMVTDGKLLPDAEKTADKLGVRIRHIFPTQSTLEFGTPDKKMVESKPISSVNIDPILMEKIKELGSFEDLYKKIKGLEGQKVFLLGNKGDFNIIKSFDNSGMTRVSKNGKQSKKKVPIEAFRYTFNRLRQNGFVTRDEVNQKFPQRCSSIVVAVLASVLPVEVATDPKITLKVKV